MTPLYHLFSRFKWLSNMATPLLPNRLSKKIAPDALTKIRQAIQLLQEALGEDTFIADADYKALPKMADKRKQETDDVYGIAQNYPEFMEAPLSFAEIERDKAFYELCDFIMVLLKPVLIRLEREQNIAGAEYLNACRVFEQIVAFKAAQGSSKAKNILIQLSQINRNRGGGAPKSA
jgi:hypothetical protein